MELTEIERRLIAAVREAGEVKLRELSFTICQSRGYTQRLSRDLERRGYLEIAPRLWKTDSLHIKLKADAHIIARPDFDKLLFSTVWV